VLLRLPAAAAVALFALWLSPGLPSRALAQSDDAERARALFAEGIDLADHGDWATAVDRFERALALRSAPSIQLNLALSLAHLGRLVDALRRLDEMGDPAAIPQDLRGQARELREEIAPRIGRITVRVRGDASACVTEVGLRRLTPEEIGQPVAIDPGQNRVRLLCGQRLADEIEVTVPDGGAAHVVLAMEPAPAAPVQAPAPTDVPPPATPGGGDVTSEAWFWVVIGVVAAGAIAGGTAAAVLASQPSPTTGDFGPPVLRFELTGLGR